MEQLVTSEFKLGIIAGGQLGKMLLLAASNWDVQVWVMDGDPQCPASRGSSRFVQGDPMNFDDVYSFGKQVDLLTFEVEAVNIAALRQLQAEGKRIAPDPSVLETIQDKGLQKLFYREHQLPTAAFRSFDSREAILDEIAGGRLAPPFVQKLRTGGYDGKGVSVIRDEDSLDRLMEGPSIVEDLVPISQEISVIVARNRSGEIRCFPPTLMEFNEDANLVEKLLCPAGLEDGLASEAEGIATALASALELSGVLAVEMFVDVQGKLWINESAPRPHNSGHHTIESIVTSQYEQMLRAIFNFPLGSTRIKCPAIMINLLGEPGYRGRVRYEGLTECMALEGVKIHLYGKRNTHPFRKMGHVTILSEDLEHATEIAEKVKERLKIKAWNDQV